MRGPSGVLTSFNSCGMDIDWLKGIPGVPAWNQPIWTIRPCGSWLKVWAA